MFKDLYLIAGIIGILSLVFVWVLISIGLIYKQQDTNKRFTHIQKLTCVNVTRKQRSTNHSPYMKEAFSGT